MTTDRRILAPNINLAYRLYSIEGYDPLYLESYGRLITSSEQTSFPEKSKPFNRIVTTSNLNSPIIDILGVKHILSLTKLSDPKLELIMQEGDTRLYKNKQVFPRAFLTDSEDIFSLTVDNVIPVDITSYSSNQVNLHVESIEPTRLILTDSWHPNWKVFIDSHEVETASWYGLRATIIPEGSHEVVYKYRHTQL